MLTSLLVLSFLIFFHELGHFVVARFFKVHVEVFSIGFGKKLACKKFGDTSWCISAIPLGGYVKMKGQDDSNPLASSTDEDSYNSKPAYQRALIVLAGPFANFILAYLLFVIVAVSGVSEISNIVGGVQQDSPAYFSGIKKGDKIVKINNQKINSWNDISDIIPNHKQINLVIERDNRLLNLQLIPRYEEVTSVFKEKIQKRVIGIMAEHKIVIHKYTITESLTYGYTQTIRVIDLIITSLQKMIAGIISPKEMGGIISIVKVTDQVAAHGIIPVLVLAAMLSVNLGVLNLLPIPALDGGHFIFHVYEMITRRKPNEKVMYILTIIGWVLLLGLMIFATYNDIDKFFLQK